MKAPELPAIDPNNVPIVRGSLYPAHLAARMGDRARRRLGDACGLTHIGVNLVTLGPGAQSALRHWHTHEDEFIYVLSGEVTLVTDAGEQVLGAGMAAGFPAGRDDAHHLINRSSRPAQYLEIGERVEADQCSYPDDDLRWQQQGGRWIAAHKDGTPYHPED